MGPQDSILAKPRPGRLFIWAGAALLLAACSHRPAPPTGLPASLPAASPPSSANAAAAPADTLALRAQIRGLAKTHCGTCHQATLATAKPAALAIYNLDAEDWSSTLTAARLEGGFTRRLNARLNERDRELLRAFVGNEVALRRK